MVDEFCQIAIVGGILGYALVPAVYEYVEVKFSVQVRGEHAIVGANGAYLCSSSHQLPQLYVYAIQVGIQ